ncbi:MAG: hypothetical protein ABIB79_05100 [archaeon]
MEEITDKLVKGKILTIHTTDVSDGLQYSQIYIEVPNQLRSEFVGFYGRMTPKQCRELRESRVEFIEYEGEDVLIQRLISGSYNKTVCLELEDAEKIKREAKDIIYKDINEVFCEGCRPIL